MIRIAEVIALQTVYFFFFLQAAFLVTVKKNLETLYIDGVVSSDQVHYVSIKILEIPLFKVILREVERIAAEIAPQYEYVSISKGAPRNIKKKNF